jgi:hypothetical protein
MSVLNLGMRSGAGIPLSTAQRLAVLALLGAEPAGPKYHSILMAWSNQGLAVDPVGADRVIRPVAKAGTLVRAAVYGMEGTGSCVINVKKVSHNDYGSASPVSICGSTPPTIVSDYKSQDLVLSGWTKSFADSDIFIGEIVSCSDFRQIVLLLEIES